MPDPARLAPFRVACRYPKINVSEQTLRNYHADGLFTAYRIEGRRGLFVDPEEAYEELMQAPPGRVRLGYGKTSPNAKVRTLVTAHQPQRQPGAAK